MRKGNLFILLLAVVMGVVAAYLASDWISEHTAQTPQQATVVVAAAPMPFGTTLSQDNIKEIHLPSGAVPEGAFTTKAELFKDGRRAVLAPLQRNELVLKTKITGPG